MAAQKKAPRVPARHQENAERGRHSRMLVLLALQPLTDPSDHGRGQALVGPRWSLAFQWKQNNQSASLAQLSGKSRRAAEESLIRSQRGEKESSHIGYIKAMDGESGRQQEGFSL